MKSTWWVALLTLACLFAGEAVAGPDREPTSGQFAAGASYTACVAPQMDCEAVVVDEIGRARRTILVQAYSFTSKPIAEALFDAKMRGVRVMVILDLGQLVERGAAAVYLRDASIPVFVDTSVASAHNKVMVFDGKTVLTGSFNFSRAATRNAENLIVIRGDKALVKLYTDNWYARQAVSEPY